MYFYKIYCECIVSFVSSSSCSISRKACLLYHTRTPTHTYTQTPMQATRSYNCPHRDPMMTSHHRRYKDNLINSAVLLSLYVFDFTVSSYVACFPIIRPFFLLPPVYNISFFLFFQPITFYLHHFNFFSHTCIDPDPLETGIFMCLMKAYFRREWVAVK